MTNNTMNGKTKLKKISLLLLPVFLVSIWAISRQTPHLRKIAEEIGSIPQYRVGIYPQSYWFQPDLFSGNGDRIGNFSVRNSYWKIRIAF